MIQKNCIICSKVLYINPDFESEEDTKICPGCQFDRNVKSCNCGAHKLSPKTLAYNLHADFCDRYGLDTFQHPRKLKTYESTEPDKWKK